MTENVALSIRQFTEAWRTMCQMSPALSGFSGAGFECIFSGAPIPFFNMAFVTSESVSEVDLRQIGNAVLAWAHPTGLPWMLVVTQEALAADTNATAILDECGYAPVMALTGMLATKVDPPTIPAGVVLQTPQDEAAYAQILDINSAAYKMPMDAAKPLMSNPAFWSGHFPVLEMAELQSVATASVLMVDGVRYVALVATMPAMQRRGYADAAMRHALHLAAETHGEVPSVLHATDAGKPVYQRMGYETISTHTIFMDKALLAGN